MYMYNYIKRYSCFLFYFYSLIKSFYKIAYLEPKPDYSWYQEQSRKKTVVRLYFSKCLTASIDYNCLLNVQIICSFTFFILSLAQKKSSPPKKYICVRFRPLHSSKKSPKNKCMLQRRSFLFVCRKIKYAIKVI